MLYTTKNQKLSFEKQIDFVDILTKKLKTLNSEIFCVHSTRAKQKKCYDVTLSKQEGSTARYLASALVLGTGRPVETQDVFFWCLAGRSTLTGLAIVHWIGCINAIKIFFHPSF